MTRMKYDGASLIVIIAFCLLLTLSSASSPPIPKTLDVTISNFTFTPQNLTIRKGDLINWTNNDQVIHTLWITRVADQSTYEVSPPILPSESWSHTFNETGVLKYYSFEHLWMTGFITINPLVHDIAVDNVTATPTEVTVGDKVSISVMVENQGNVLETFNVTAYYNSTNWIGIETEEDVSLSRGANTTLAISWDTKDVSPGTYIIRANATKVLGEADLTDNSYTSDAVIIKAPQPLFPTNVVIAVAIVAVSITVVAIYFVRVRFKT